MSEAQYLALLSRDLGYIPAAIAEGHLSEATALLKMLITLRKKVQRSA